VGRAILPNGSRLVCIISAAEMQILRMNKKQQTNKHRCGGDAGGTFLILRKVIK